MSAKSWTIALGCAAVCGLALLAQAATRPATATTPRAFSNEKAAVDALITAAEAYDVPALKELLGPEGDDLIVSSDPVQDKNELQAFAKKAHERHDVVADPNNPNRAVLLIGEESWPMPIPLVRRRASWSFDTKAGQQEVLYRRIGRNELDAIEVCHLFVEAERAYALDKHNGSLNQYAQRVLSTLGKEDGLAWRKTDGSWGGPLAEEIADAIAEGYKERAEPQPYHGYYFKVLKGQGPAAPHGATDFLVRGAMIGGFALVAAPADYRKSGVKTFIVSHDGVVYEQDLGARTLERFREMTLYNPSKTWTPVDESPTPKRPR